MAARQGELRRARQQGPRKEKRVRPLPCHPPTPSLRTRSASFESSLSLSAAPMAPPANTLEPRSSCEWLILEPHGGLWKVLGRFPE